MSDERAKQLATMLRALETLEREKSEYMTDWKDRRVRLENAIAATSEYILSGQLTIADAVKNAVDQVNSGLLDKDGVKVTASVGPAA